jgi:hypothetical protein
MEPIVIQSIDKDLLADILHFDFDIFSRFRGKEQEVLRTMALHCMSSLGLIERLRLPVDTLTKLFKHIENSFYYASIADVDETRKIALFHCTLHTADVLQFVTFLLSRNILNGYFTDTEAFSLVVAALIHDYRHPNVHESFLYETGNPLAYRYNNEQVTQRFALAEFFKTINIQEINILRSFKVDDAQAIKSAIIELVLATDMKLSLDIMARFAVLSSSNKSVSAGHRMLMGQAILKVSDLSHGCRSTAVHEKWMEMVCEEMFYQVCNLLQCICMVSYYLFLSFYNKIYIYIYLLSGRYGK